MSKHRFALDLITLYDPGFWGVADHDGILSLEPRAMWDRMLDAIDSLEITGVEVTFPPGDIETAHLAYGGSQGLLDALGQRDLGWSAATSAGSTCSRRRMTRRSAQSVIAAAKEYAAGISGAGGEIVIGGMPSLDSSVDRGGRFVDLEYVKRLADLVNNVGLAVAERGLRYGMHPEFGSVFCRRRDIDLFMLLTDPEYVGFCPDTAHITLAGGDPVAITEQHRDRLLLTHWKDADGPFEGPCPRARPVIPQSRPKFKQVGEGAVDWNSWQLMLDRIGYDGWAVLELDSSADPLDAGPARA